MNYFNGVVRANRLLKYLNNSRINSRVDINSKNPSELVAYLPEYGNMAVTLMSDDPYRIGNVNTWNTQLQFNQQAAHNLAKTFNFKLTCICVNVASHTRYTIATKFIIYN